MLAKFNMVKRPWSNNQAKTYKKVRKSSRPGSRLLKMKNKTRILKSQRKRRRDRRGRQLFRIQLGVTDKEMMHL